MRAWFFFLVVAPLCAGCSSCSLWGDPYPPKQPLPEEFEPCTENFRCAEGLECFVGGGECRDTPEFYSFCARPCESDLDCGGLPLACASPPPYPTVSSPFPHWYCRRPCELDEDCPTGLAIPWDCGDPPPPGVCFLDINAFDCTPLDAGKGTTDAGT